jgi:hypothetical protein
MTMPRRSRPGLALAAVLLSVVAACQSGTPAVTPTPTAPPASVPAAAEPSPGVTVDGATVTIVGQGRSESDAFALPAGSATMTITACRSNGVMPFITLLDENGQSVGLIVDPEKVLNNLVGGDYRISAQANPDCLWQVVIAPQ